MRSNHTIWPYSLTATLLLLSPFDLLASLGMDMYLPVVPYMPDAIGTTPNVIQLTLSIYLVMLGAGQLLFGPLSDRFGRRPILLWGSFVYLLASFGLAVSSSINLFLVCRFAQACGASACLVAMFATVRDIYAGREESNVIYGILGSMLAIVPAVGPIMGALIDMWMGWRLIFAVLGILMTIAYVSAWRFWPETRHQRTTDLSWSQFLLPLKKMNFWLYTFCYSAGMGSFFVFFSTAPQIMMGRQGLSPLLFSMVFATVAIAMMITARIIGKLIPVWGSLKVMRVAMGCLILGGVMLIISELLLPHWVPGFIAPMWIIGMGIAMSVSISPNGALQGFDELAGTVTAVYFCLGGVLLGSIGTVIISIFPVGTSWPIVAFCFILAAIVIALYSILASDKRIGS